MRLDFKQWAESIFGRAVMEPEPASEFPDMERKRTGNATLDLTPLPGNKKPMKKQKKN